MFGAVAKTYYAEKIGKQPEDIFVVSRHALHRQEVRVPAPGDGRLDGVPDVDVVLTTRELVRMIKQAGIDFDSLPDEKMDKPLGLSTGAADIFANTGGVMEAALRTVYEIVTGTAAPVREPARRPDRRARRASRKPSCRSRAPCRSGRSSKASR